MKAFCLLFNYRVLIRVWRVFYCVVLYCIRKAAFFLDYSLTLIEAAMHL